LHYGLHRFRQASTAPCSLHEDNIYRAVDELKATLISI
jgi:hypothetical protein